MDYSSIYKKIDSGIRFFLYLLIFWLPYSKAVVETSVILGLLLWLAKRILIVKESWDEKSSPAPEADYKRLWPRLRPAKSFLDKPIGLFIVMTLVSTFVSDTAWACFYGFLTKNIEWFVIYFLVIEVFTKSKYVWIAFGIFIFTSTATVLDSLVQFYWTHKDFFFGYPVSDNRATGSFNHSNDLAGYLTFVIPSSMVLLFVGKKSLPKFFLSIGVVLLSIWSLFVTFSRGAWLGVLTGGILFLYFVSSQRKPFLMFVAVFLIFCSGIFFTSNKKEFRLGARQVQDTVNWRSTLWEDSIKMVLNRPNFGYGPNTFMPVFVNFSGTIRGKGYYAPTYAHNCFIQMAAELGIWGLLSFLGIIGALFYKVIGQIRSSRIRDFNLKILSCGLLTGTGAFLGHSFVDTNLFSLQLSSLFWFMVGLQVAIYSIQSQPSGNDC